MAYLSMRYSLFKNWLKSKIHVDLHQTEPVPQPATLPETSAWAQEGTHATNGLQKREPRLNGENSGQANIDLPVPWEGCPIEAYPVMKAVRS